MSGWIAVAYFLPDDGGETFVALMTALPHTLSRGVVCQAPTAYRLRLGSLATATFLRMAVQEIAVADDEHPYLDEGDLYVPDAARPDCERELASRCMTGATWHQIVLAEFRNTKARATFEAALSEAWP